MLDEKLNACIETAIGREEEAVVFYNDLAGQVNDDAARETLLWIGDEEKKHKIAEHLEEPEASDAMRREEVFLLAAHRELRSFQFYSELAALYEEGSEIRDMLLRIANEELKHKEKMEYLYANTSFPQTDGG